MDKALAPAPQSTRWSMLFGVYSAVVGVIGSVGPVALFLFWRGVTVAPEILAVSFAGLTIFGALAGAFSYIAIYRRFLARAQLAELLDRVDSSHSQMLDAVQRMAGASNQRG